MKYRIIILSLLTCSIVQGKTLRVLFLGNSYTYVNNSPQLVADMAASTGDTLIFDTHTPGGYSLWAHNHDTVSLQKIQAGNWDYVVLQEQSLKPSWPDNWIESDVFPAAHSLDSIINIYNQCGETMFYMTWGYKNGNPFSCAAYPWWPYACTYEVMDSLTNLRYRMMADSNHAVLSPAGAVWHYIRDHYPAIELYAADENHPSLAGSYAAACSFYTAMFKKDPTLISFNSSLSAVDAADIRDAAKIIVYDSLMNWHVGEYDPLADYSYFISDTNQITFTNNSLNATSYSWNFGDGDTSSAVNPIHTYTASGLYTVTLIATHCNQVDSMTQTINAGIAGISFLENNLSTWNIYPNPSTQTIIVKMKVAGDLYYKIFSPSGKEIQSGKINDLKKEIDIINLSNGLYFLQLRANNISFGLQKFIKTSQ